MFSLDGKNALVTGASGDIGKSIALALHSAGAQVIISGTRLEPLEALRNELGDRVQIILCDLSDKDAVQLLPNKALETVGSIDILINNAGMQYRNPLEDFPSEMFEQLLRTNISSVFNVSQVVARHMIKRGQGKIINIASVQTLLARPGIAPYTATKGAVGNLTKGMATDWAKYGLQCNAIAPGYFDTPLNATLVSDKDFTAWLEKRTPAGRWGEVEELVGASIFLSSSASNFVNGHTLYVDGGITASL